MVLFEKMYFLHQGEIVNGEKQEGTFGENAIEQYDLVFSSKNEQGIKLAQALYPLDASNEQIAKLADGDDLIDVDIIDPNGDCGLVLFIVGDNRD